MKFLSDLTLRTRITLYTALAILVGISIFSFLGIRAVNQSTQSMLDDRLTTARVVASYIDETLARALSELKNTAREIENDPAENNYNAHLAELADIYSHLSVHYKDSRVLDGQGRILWSGRTSGANRAVDISAYPVISRAINQTEAGISGMVLAPVSGEPVVLLASPLRGNRAVVVTIDLVRSSISGFIRQIRLGDTGYVEIVDQNGIVIARTDPGPELAPFEKSDHSGRFADLISAGQPTRGLCHSCHEPTERVFRKDILAFVPLSETKWGVVIRQAEEEALAPVNELRQNLLIFGAGLTGLAFLLVAVTTRGVVSRIRVLTSASRRIAEGDLSSPVRALGKDEVGKLAQTFDGMRVRLKDSHAALERKTSELSSLLSVSEILTSLPDLYNLRTALGGALDRTLEIMNTRFGGILLLDDEKKTLTYWAQRGLSRKNLSGVSCRLGEGITGKVAQTGEPVLITDISADPRAAFPDTLDAPHLKSFLSVPLRSQGRVLGVINIASRGPRAFSTPDIQLLGSIAAQVSGAIENASLHREVQRKEEVRGELLQEMLSIQEVERKRIARELHDETSQSLASLVASLEAMAGMLPEGADKIRERMKKTQSLSISILDEIHKLIYELRPSLLDDLGLVAAARWLAENNLETAGIKVEFQTAGREKRLPFHLEATLFRVIQEAFSNITRHARANNAAVRLEFRKNMVRVRIEDDGRGFDVAEAIKSQNRPRGLGLLGMKERVELVAGTLEIRSRPGGGTRIDIEIPSRPAGGTARSKNAAG